MPSLRLLPAVACLSLCPVVLLAAFQAAAPRDAIPPAAATQTTTALAEKPHPPVIPILEKGVIYVKGAVASASDATTPVPENGKMADGRYHNAYFGLSYTLLAHWTEEPAGPPPSNGGSYVLTQFATREKGSDRVKATILISAQDLFFSALSLPGPLEMLQALRHHLSQNFKVEREPEPVELGGRRFARLAYTAPVAGLHWRLFATEVRCHVLLFTVSGQDQASLDAAERTIGNSVFTAAGAAAPPCVAGYANDAANVLERVEPHLTEHRFNPIPVRLLIDAEGRVKHIHLLSAFPEQAEAILAALRQWRFKPYQRDGTPSEVETGLTFGKAPTLMRRQERPVRPPRHGDTGHN